MTRDLTEECLRILNKGFFEITDPGPLHQPIRSFSIRRDEKLHLILETEAPPMRPRWRSISRQARFA